MRSLHVQYVLRSSSKVQHELPAPICAAMVEYGRWVMSDCFQLHPWLVTTACLSALSEIATGGSTSASLVGRGIVHQISKHSAGAAVTGRIGAAFMGGVGFVSHFSAIMWNRIIIPLIAGTRLRG
jgi:hypothetical protein